MPGKSSQQHRQQRLREKQRHDHPEGHNPASASHQDIDSSASSLKHVLPAGPWIRYVDGLSNLRAALLADAQRMSQSSGSNHNPNNPSFQSWGYIVDLSGHWATVFCCALEESRITAILFDTLDVQADAEGLYRVGILESLDKETSSKFSIGFKIILLAPVSEFRGVSSPAEESQASEVNGPKKNLKFSERGCEKDSAFRLYLNRDLLAFRRVVIQPILQARRDETCLSRGLAVLLWLFSFTTPNNRLYCFQWFLTKSQDFEMDVAVEARGSNQPWQDAGSITEEPQRLEVSPQPGPKPIGRCQEGYGDLNGDGSGAHDSIPESALWAAECATFEPASRLIAADGSPDRFGRGTHCMVQSIQEARRRNEAVHTSSADSELCRRQGELAKQLDSSLNDAIANAKACDASERAILQAAVEHWNNFINLDEDQKLLSDCRDTDLNFSQVSSHSCLMKFFLYGRLRGVRSLSGPCSDDNNPYNLVRIPFSVLPFPKLFERLQLRDFLTETSESLLKALLLRLAVFEEAPEKHWAVAVSDFELGGGGSDVEFWNPLSAAKEVRAPRKLDMKTTHKGVRR
eukprot:TRINITY_DN73958_c0_g1_i1.p1 TRINITY_DN73958_c0_g1~~TRINITY_DN73958_c0_g1_i1.p1  ORF type:complete len:574 (+),score=70.95 TRINITY_DN73958_c0_g1_i1:144-1865(+)